MILFISNLIWKYDLSYINNKSFILYSLIFIMLAFYKLKYILKK